jgi:serine/threonine protein kinase
MLTEPVSRGEARMPSKLLEKRLQKIGPYDVIELLAAGGTSFIYKGRQGISGEIVAIKVPKEQMAENSVSLKRFEQEFGVARLLEHRHLIRVLQFGYHEGKPYIVMEYIEGESLGDRIQREGALPEAEALRIIAEAASALEAAHKRKIIHRDVKPDNILLTPEGKAKLTDLGLAKDVEADRNWTQPLKGMGTPFFISPEQFNDAKHADVRSDVYALAATLYMAVTGKPPFLARGNLTIWKKKLSNDLVPPRQLAPDLSERVEKALCRALSADPDARPATCRQFIKELGGGKTSRTLRTRRSQCLPPHDCGSSRSSIAGPVCAMRRGKKERAERSPRKRNGAGRQRCAMFPPLASDYNSIAASSRGPCCA